VEKRPDCAFWFYTRSFIEADLFIAMTELAEFKNCQGWLSADADNYEQAVLARCTGGNAWKIALLQDKELDVATAAVLVLPNNAGGVVNFPYHRGGHHVAPLKLAGITTCPAVTGVYPLQSNGALARPCQICAFCLP